MNNLYDLLKQKIVRMQNDRHTLTRDNIAVQATYEHTIELLLMSADRISACELLISTLILSLNNVIMILSATNIEDKAKLAMAEVMVKELAQILGEKS
jgi:hypothetical protein